MSAPAVQPAPLPAPPAPIEIRPKRGRRAWRRWIVIALIVAATGVFGARYGIRAYRALDATPKLVIPTAKVQRGDVTLTITARGELRGGNSEVMFAPMTGGTELHITSLTDAGTPVKTGEIVVQFDTTEQEYKLREAEADLAEAEQQIVKARATAVADAEEDRYALEKAAADVRTAELDVRKNPLVPAITAKQNDLALDAARDHLTQLQHNIANRKATDEAGIAMQEAGRGKAEAQAKIARQNIDNMTLRAHRDGYVALRQNTNITFGFFGMTLPLFQVGDTVRPGMAVAEIPDLKNWEVGANIAELDRGHIAKGGKAQLTIVALPQHPFTGHVKEIGGTNGPPWDRHFECKIALDNPAPELRPGMSANAVLTTDEMRNVLSLPSQALFEASGKTYVYVQTASGFSRKDVKLVRRNEMRVVVEGLAERQAVALADPAAVAKKTGAASSNPMQSLHK
ncbi:MAG TPA: efflux RND transporter periplasmic adaptor subunit [Bryobacteraceae bacterium]|nr:efflux RND transporter periplasmic adaptor subunit [Bryobacteraceae bacterium]